MKKNLIVLLFALSMVILAVPGANAANGGVPVGSCPKGFVLHELMDHTGDHEGHIGVAENLNETTTICVKHLKSGYHVHIDDVVNP